MHIHSEHLRLSPSDVTAFLACEHLTTLSLAHARGELDRPDVENEQAELIFRKGLEHERAYLEHLRADGKTVLEIARPARRLGRRRPRDRRGDPGRRGRRRLPGRLRARATGAASPTSSCGGRTAPTRRSTRSSRAARSPPTSSSSASTASSSRGSRGREPEQIHVLLGTGEQATLPARASSAPTTGASARGSSSSSPTRRRPSRTRSTTAASATSRPLCDARWDEVDHLSRVAGVCRDADREARAPPGSRRSPQLGRAPRRARAGRDRPPTRGREAPRAGRAPARARARPASDSYRAAAAAGRKPASRSCPSPRPATSSSTSRATRSGTATAALEYLWGILDADGAFTPLHAHDRDTERRAFEQFVDLVHARLARVPRHARLPLRRLRDHRAASG